MKQPTSAGSCKHVVSYCRRVNCKSRKGDEDDKPIPRSVLPNSLASLRNLDFILQAVKAQGRY